MQSEALSENFEMQQPSLKMLDDYLANLNLIYPKFSGEYSQKIGEVSLAVIGDKPENSPIVLSKLERAGLMSEAINLKGQIAKGEETNIAASDDDYGLTTGGHSEKLTQGHDGVNNTKT